jgi:hypothetical protein
MMNKIKLLGIIIGTLVIATAAISAVSMKLTTVSFGLLGETEPRFTLRGFYDKSITMYSGAGYYLQLDPMNGTFSGWFYATNGYHYNFSGTYDIEGSTIKGTWLIGRISGWISGHIGI